VDAGAIAAILTASAGLGAVIVTALKSRGEGTTAIVSQQTAIMQDMKLLNDELRATFLETKLERDELKDEVILLRREVTKLRIRLEQSES
jgi:putative NADH-flavin reductase